MTSLRNLFFNWANCAKVASTKTRSITLECLAFQFYFRVVSARKVSAIELIREQQGRKAPSCDNRRGDLTNYARHLWPGSLPSPTLSLLADYFQPRSLRSAGAKCSRLVYFSQVASKRLSFGLYHHNKYARYRPKKLLPRILKENRNDKKSRITFKATF